MTPIRHSPAIALLATSLLLAPAAQAAAEEGAQTTQVALKAVARPEPKATGAYRLGIGDVLQISVYGEDGSASEVPVDPSGHISYRIVGSVKAAERTIDELRADLQERVSKTLRHGLVTIVPLRFGSLTFTILGQVGKPGTYPIEGRMTVFDALACGGGLMCGQYRSSSVDLYDLQHATLLRHGQAIPMDFEALIQRGDATQDLPLESGDIITIPSALVRNIYVLGEVNYPRTVGVVSSVSLIQVLTEARGLKDSASGKLLVIRGSVTHPQVTQVSVKHLLDGSTRDIQLAPGDIVFAPPRSLQILDDIVRAALSGFASGSAAQSAAGIYDANYRRNSSDGSTSSPVAVP